MILFNNIYIDLITSRYTYYNYDSEKSLNQSSQLRMFKIS